MVQGLVSLGGGRVFWGAHILVVALQVLVEEVRVHELGVSPGSSSLVHWFTLVEEFVAANCVQTAEVAPLEAEEEVLAVGLWLELEPVTVDVYLITHDNECPNPGHSLKHIETVKWDPKSLIVEVSSLTFLRKVLIVLLRDEVDDRASQIHEPNRQK